MAADTKTCRACKAEIPGDARKCSHCGTGRPTDGIVRGVAIGVGVVVAVLLMVFAYAIFQGLQPGTPKSKFCPVGTLPGETVPDGC